MKKETFKNVSARQIRRAFYELAEDICRNEVPVNVRLNGNTFTIHLEGGSINISFNNPAAALATQKGGQA